MKLSIATPIAILAAAAAFAVPAAAQAQKPPVSTQLRVQVAAGEKLTFHASWKRSTFKVHPSDGCKLSAWTTSRLGWHRATVVVHTTTTCTINASLKSHPGKVGGPQPGQGTMSYKLSNIPA